MMSPIRVMSTASSEKNMILAHQWPPVPCSCGECINTSPSPSAAAVPRGSSTPSSSEKHIIRNYNLISMHTTYHYFILYSLPFFLFLSLRFLGCTSPDMVHKDWRSQGDRDLLYCFITLSKQWTYNELAYMTMTRVKWLSKCVIFMNKGNVWRTMKF